MRSVNTAVAIIIIALVLVGCATLGIGTPNYSQLTSPKGKLAFLYSLYNKQYEDYKVQVIKPNLTATEKQTLKVRKDVMIKVYPIIQALDLAFVEGKPWDTKNEQLVISYLRQLGAKIK